MMLVHSSCLVSFQGLFVSARNMMAKWAKGPIVIPPCRLPLPTEWHHFKGS